MKNILFVVTSLVIVFVLGVQQAEACTSVIVSGRVTKDGRPLIYKNRDTESLHNMCVVVQGSKYRYVGLVNAKDVKPENVWGGHNEAGFAIINTAAFNLNGDEGDTDGDGILMRKALELCASLEDFETLLDTVQKPRHVNSNFAVLDSKGGCAYYETGNFNYVKFDVNDPAVAPDGYLMRTNFGTTGKMEKGLGFERYCAITDFMTDAFQKGKLEHDYLITSASRYLRHGVTKMDMYDFMPESESEPRYFPIGDYITRHSTSSAILIQGVQPKESPLNTISWTIVGWPLTTITVPLVLTPSGKLPKLITNDGTGHSPLNEMGLLLKARIFSLANGNKKSYIDLAQLLNKQGTGILQRVLTVEQEVMQRGEAAIAKFRKNPKHIKDIEAFYDWTDQYVAERYKTLFDVQ